MTRVVASLISHTNIGKTTLTRTLLKRDVGEIRDEAHVTAESEAFTLLAVGDDELLLWDTPGFGFVGNILKRLGQEGGAVGWLMHEVVDRMFNKPLYSSLEAAKNVRREADVALYLVNVREKPQDAQYVAMELQLLQALEKPVILVLNQIDDQQWGNRAALDALVASWRTHFGRDQGVHALVVLDAFTRTWQQELVLLDTMAGVLPQDKRAALLRLRQHFLDQQQQRVRQCAEAAAKVQWFALQQRIHPKKGDDPKKVLQDMAAKLQAQIDQYVDTLIVAHGIEADGRAKLKSDMAAVSGLVGKPLEEKRTGLFAGLASSVGSGLMADVLSGGMTFGGGAILGFLGGFLGGVSYARLFNFFRRSGEVAWQQEPLQQLFKMLVAYYLLTALHGRGKGRLAVDEPAPFILQALDVRWSTTVSELNKLLEHDVDANPNVISADFQRDLVRLFESTVDGAVARIYPQEDNG